MNPTTTLTVPSPSFSVLAGRMRGRVATAADPDWDEVRYGFNLATDLRPAGIALPLDATDVAAAVRFARANGLRVAPQGGAHNPAAFGPVDDVLIVDTRELGEIAIDAPRRSVRVGAGVRWHQITARLSELGLAALHGSSPHVGIAGYSLGGGMGWLARKHGLQTNSVTALEVVTADGAAIRVDAEHEPDLFWALRGGNGNYGVVTAIEFDVYPVPELYAGGLFFPHERSSEVLHAWTALAPEMPDEMMTWASLLHLPEDPAVPAPLRGRAFAIVHGAFLGEEEEGRELLRSLRDLRPEIDTMAMVPPVELGDMAMDPPEPLPYMSATALLSDLPGDAIEDLLAAAGPGSGAPLPLVQLRQMGGALGRAVPGAGARATLGGSYCLFSLGVPEDGESARAVRASLDDVQGAAFAHRAGDYPNFVEEPADARAFWDEDTWAELRRVKSAYDPEDRFLGNHRIPPAA
jgi:FAD/FMN-containing dehydrogenase